MKIIPVIKQKRCKENNFAILDKNITRKAGVYFLFNSELELIYIGKSKNIRQRLVQHCSDNSIKIGTYDYPNGSTPCDKGEVCYFSNIFDTKYNLKYSL